MKLVIAEKPSVAFALSKAMGIKGGRKDGYIEGGGYYISWCIGHLIALAEPNLYDDKYAKWKYADLPIMPDEFKYKISGDKNKQFIFDGFYIEDKPTNVLAKQEGCSVRVINDTLKRCREEIELQKRLEDAENAKKDNH